MTNREPTALVEPPATDRPDGRAGYLPPRRFPRWAVVLAVVLLVIGAGMMVAWPINLPYYAYAPGPVYDVGDFISIEADDVATYESMGDLFFLTVAPDEANLMEVIGALLDKRVELRRREVVRPAGVSKEQQRRRTLRSMDESQMFATYVALNYLGYDAELIESGAMVVTVMEGTAADGVLEVEDVIAAIDGMSMELDSDVVAYLADRSPGDSLALTVLRFDEKGEEIEHEFVITLGQHPEDPERGFVGIGLDFVEWIGDFEVDVAIDSRNIGGPSAGTMFSLQIIDLLTEEDLTKGYRIAGTGTISQDGTVGPIGGVQQKVYGAISIGAEYMLVPAGQNYEDAVGPAGDDIVLDSLVPAGQAQAEG
jgi:PDZ domain-containing protein